MKTAFLLALASAKRVSELHGLSYVVSWSPDKTSATLSLAPDFIAKTQTPGDPKTSYQAFKIPALSTILNPDDSDILLCPLRSLQMYLTKTAASRPRCPRLFVSAAHILRHKPVSKNTVSSWIRKVIQLAYSDLPDTERALWKVSVHEVRALATSLLFRHNTSLSEVMQAASWRCRSTFVSFYLRDVGHRFLDISSLGPIVAAQAVISSSQPACTPSTSSPDAAVPSRRKKKRGGAPIRK